MDQVVFYPPTLEPGCGPFLFSPPRKASTERAMSGPRLLTDISPLTLQMTSRTPGVHVSGIITAMCQQMGIYGTDELPVSYLELGCAMEWALNDRLQRDEPNRYISTGEIELDGVFGHPDLFDTQDDAVEEIKLAWMSVRQEVEGEKMWRYWVQIKAYCKMLGVNVGRLRVYHVNGDYGENRHPEYRHWEWRFTDDELNENWLMLMNNAHLAVPEAAA